jgi:hypothetical protein
MTQYEDVASVWERDEILMVPNRGCMLGDTIWSNQGTASLQLFSHLFVVEHFYVEGEAASYEDDLLSSYAFSFSSSSQYCSKS